MIRYRECQRNHAAHLGSRVVDGCGEFMPAGDEGTPQSLRCAACDCHRSFHRREVEGDTTPTSAAATQPPLLLHTTAATDNRYISFNNSHSHHHHRRGAVMVAFGGGGGGGGGAGVESSSDDQLNEYQQQQMERQQRSRKRFRTKFTQDDKDKMTALAERIGWRMQKEEEEQVQRLCSEIGIKRKVFKVWMHNNKHTNSKSKLP